MLKQNLQLIDDSSEGKKPKGTKKCASNGKLKIENCKSCLEAIQLENEINHLEKKMKLIQIILKKIIKNLQKTINQY